ncbi:hypothetical protein ACFXJ5_04960 [Streptomyces sp. NPDC059373]
MAAREGRDDPEDRFVVVAAVDEALASVDRDRPCRRGDVGAEEEGSLRYLGGGVEDCGQFA